MKQNNKTNKKKKSRKGVSVLIGYVLLIVFSIVLGILTYKLLKTYGNFVEKPTCPDGTSLMIESYTYDCNLKTLSINFLNNGKFDIGGYFIRGSESPDKLAYIELSNFNLQTQFILNPGIKFGGITPKNALQTNKAEVDNYNLAQLDKELSSIEIVPIIWMTQNRKMQLVSCEDAKIKKDIQCS
jgi:hypothetical protein